MMIYGPKQQAKIKKDLSMEDPSRNNRAFIKRPTVEEPRRMLNQQMFSCKNLTTYPTIPCQITVPKNELNEIFRTARVKKDEPFPVISISQKAASEYLTTKRLSFSQRSGMANSPLLIFCFDGVIGWVYSNHTSQFLSSDFSVTYQVRLSIFNGKF